MAQASVVQTEPASVIRAKPGSMNALLVFVFTAAFVFLGISRLAPPAAVPASAPLTVFSSARAMKYLEIIAQDPHPIGSAEHNSVRDYLVSTITRLGLTPEVQKTTVASSKRGAPIFAATVQNIFARFKGTGTGKAILLVGHYDSVPNAPGASDDGASIAAILETIRAISAGPPLKNDLIFLFTDGEEVGLLGAKAFADEHDWVKDVRVVLNFEARGSRGPAMVFETSDENGWLIEQLAKAAPYPIASSFMSSIYKLLPNDTDFTVFKMSGISGLNVAYIDAPTSYHTQLDSLNNIDERSLQHQGSYALALARNFGDLDLAATKGSNSIYFDIFGAVLIHYPAKWVLPFTGLVLVLVIVVVALGLRRGQLSLGKVALGFFLFLLNVTCAVLAVSFIWWIVRAFHGQYRLLPFGPYNSSLYLVGFASLTLALTSALYIWFGRKATVPNLLVGVLLWWAILMVLTAIYLPGSSYLFTWPLLFSLLGLGARFFLVDHKHRFRDAAIIAISYIPALTLMPPMIYLMFTAVGLSQVGALMALIVLLLGLLIPRINTMTGINKWLLPSLAALVSLGFIVAGSFTAGFSPEHPKPTNLFYALNGDTGNAIWASANDSPDDWTSQFFSRGITRTGLEEFFSDNSKAFLTSQAPAVSLPAPDISLVSADTNDGNRMLRLRITSPRQAPLMSVYVDPETEVLDVTINGKNPEQGGTPSAAQKKAWALRYYDVPSSGLDLVFKIKSLQPLRLRVVDQSYGLPEIPSFFISKRPAYIMPSSNSDVTMVSKSFSF